MEVEIRYSERTCLDDTALNEVIVVYAKQLKLKHNVVVVFDKRIKGFGTYGWSDDNNKHVIRISPERNQHHLRNHYEEMSIREVRLDKESEKYNTIASILHELFHAYQRECLGNKFYHPSFDTVDEISNPELSAWYSDCEIEARIFEYEKIRDAIEYYNSCCI